MSPRRGTTVQLVTRQGTLVGYCDVPLDLPSLPEVISIVSGRTFVLVSPTPADAAFVVYREQTFEWGENFRHEVQS